MMFLVDLKKKLKGKLVLHFIIYSSSVDNWMVRGLVNLILCMILFKKKCNLILGNIYSSFLIKRLKIKSNFRFNSWEK